MPRLVHVCPDCGAALRTFYRAGFLDDGDVEPAAECTAKACPFGY